MPRSISLVSSVQYYPQIPCKDVPSASFELKAKLETSLPCSVNGSCSINITTSGICVLLSMYEKTKTDKICL